MNSYTILIISFLVAIYLIKTIANILNVANITNEIDPEFKDYFDAQKYKTSQEYLKAQTKFAFINSTVSLFATLALIIFGAFNSIDIFARSFGLGEIWTGLIFAGVIAAIFAIIEIPFSIYNTFVIEQKFGFNTTKPKTFIVDLLKNLALGAILGGAVFALIIWFFISFGKFAWIYAFVGLSCFQLLLTFIYPVLIMPLFNKFIPLADSPLKTALEEYALRENFKMKGLFTMDNSKRSTKSNAFFTGFGRFRRIVLFDTLIAKHTTDELVSILAHEMGHYKLGHIFKHIVVGLIISAAQLFILSVFINWAGLYTAFGMQQTSVYAGIIFFGFLFSPISFILDVLSNISSRKDEYAADAYSVTTYKKPQEMINALKKLSVDNLSNLHPHKFKVFLQYSHPPVLERIKAIRKIKL